MFESLKAHVAEPADLAKVFTWAWKSRAFIWILALIAHQLVPDFDSSMQSLLPETTRTDSLFVGLFGMFLRWDSFYFITLSEHGYQYEQQHAFFPLFPLVSRALAKILSLGLGPLLSPTNIHLLAGILVSNFSFVLATLVLHQLTYRVFRHQKLALVTGLMFSLAPAGIFMSAPCSESLFALLTFSGIYCLSWNRPFLASIAFGLSAATRSNGLLSAGFFMYTTLRALPTLRSRPAGFFWLAMKNAACCLVVLAFPLAYHLHGFQLYCPGGAFHGDSASREPLSWCSQGLLPGFSLYSYVQDHYWNVGFLRYYELKQLPNFLLALPTLVLSVAGIWAAVNRDPRKFFSLGFRSSNAALNPLRFPDQRMEELYLASLYLWAFLLLYSVPMVHIQIITRLFSSLPGVYWTAATFVLSGRDLAPKRGQPVTKPLTLFFFLMYSLVGVILFSNFYPPA